MKADKLSPDFLRKLDSHKEESHINSYRPVSVQKVDTSTLFTEEETKKGNSILPIILIVALVLLCCAIAFICITKE